MTKIVEVDHRTGEPIRTIELGPEATAILDRARRHWKRLEAAGTPYWCIHEGRDVTHPSTTWVDDGYWHPKRPRTYLKHGVVCTECWGYVQEG
jgi:hypothetical protein